VNISITGTRIVFPHVQLSTIAPGVFFEQSKSCFAANIILVLEKKISNVGFRIKQINSIFF
jgi:predicted aconitase with swiveling domain